MPLYRTYHDLIPENLQKWLLYLFLVEHMLLWIYDKIPQVVHRTT